MMIMMIMMMMMMMNVCVCVWAAEILSVEKIKKEPSDDETAQQQQQQLGECVNWTCFNTVHCLSVCLSVTRQLYHSAVVVYVCMLITERRSIVKCVGCFQQCLSHISGTARPIFMKCVVQIPAWSSSDGVAICYVLLILWMMWHLAVVGHMSTSSVVIVVRSLMSMKALFILW